MRSAVKLITSFFYLGYAPVAPGTAGTLGGLLVWYLAKDSAAAYAAAGVILFTLGFLLSGKAERLYGRKDAAEIVIDEACGMMLALALLPGRLPVMIAGFILFRLFDVIKPPPARHIESLSGSLGIMGDDIVAAVYANLLLQLATRVFHLI